MKHCLFLLILAGDFWLGFFVGCAVIFRRRWSGYVNEGSLPAPPYRTHNEQEPRHWSETLRISRFPSGPNESNIIRVSSTYLRDQAEASLSFSPDGKGDAA